MDLSEQRVSFRRTLPRREGAERAGWCFGVMDAESDRLRLSAPIEARAGWFDCAGINTVSVDDPRWVERTGVREANALPYWVGPMNVQFGLLRSSTSLHLVNGALIPAHATSISNAQAQLVWPLDPWTKEMNR